MEVDLESVQPIDEVHFVPAYPLGFADQPGFGFPTHFRIMADAESENEKVLLDEMLPEWPAEALPNPGASQLMLAPPGLRARRIRISCEALWTNSVSGDYSPREFLLAISELQVWREGKNLAFGRPVAASSSLDAPRWNSAALTDGYSSREKLLNWADWSNGIERAQQLREELADVELSIRVKHEVFRLRLLWGAIGSTVLAILLGVSGMLWLRSRGKRSIAELRTRIARDLHDEIGASLSQLAIQSDIAKQHLVRGELATSRLEAISTGARQTLDQMRDVIWLLAPRASNWHELSNRLQSIANRMLDGVKHKVMVTGEPPQGKPSIEIARNVLMLLKEVLSNARRHSDAESIHVVISWDDELKVVVEDDGHGFDLKTAGETSGMGLINLEERASAVKGSLDIQSAPGEGTKVSISIPLPRDRRNR